MFEQNALVLICKHCTRWIALTKWATWIQSLASFLVSESLTFNHFPCTLCHFLVSRGTMKTEFFSRNINFQSETAASQHLILHHQVSLSVHYAM